MNLPLVDLYETDFYAWTQKQVQLLRQRDLNNLDIENLIEEIESLGKQEKRLIKIIKSFPQSVGKKQNQL
ncbi:DUF29 domain-containing protein [Floridanema evergladense]|uniref:DUF29 domain-containing protein n=1 Tax=Floridaenema evergladense BLCC-F167 TaxID=3153639 RepID=A0ABV4WR14_9CYAN